VYTFLDRPDGATTVIATGKPYYTSYHFMRGLLTNRQDYRKNNDVQNPYILVKEDKRDYQYFENQSSTGGAGLVVHKWQVTQSDVSPDNFCGLDNWTNCQHWGDMNSYNYANYELTSGDNKLIKDEVILYDQNDPTKSVSTVTNYTYDDITHLQLTQTKTSNSKQESIGIAYTYPYNYSTSVYNGMNIKHIWNKVVSTTQTKDGNFISALYNNYKSVDPYNYLIDNVETQVGTNLREERASFSSYDIRGNILTMQKTSDIKTSYLWDYDNMYPVAEVKNASLANIAYTSFEADDKGYWSYSTTNIKNTGTPVTGKKYYDLNAGNITKYGLSTSTNYVVSYWTTNSTPVSVTGSSSSAQGKTIKGWTYFEHNVTGVSTVTISGTGNLDELRLYPTTAQMTTYTYEPLIGLTSACDLNNKITYYEYDGLGRLNIVRDQDFNIVKKYCYNYAGQVVDCGAYYSNAITRAYRKTGCQSGYSGSEMPYTIAAGAYASQVSQADADQQALTALNTLGQNNADLNGSCVQNVSFTTTNLPKETHLTIKFTSIYDNSVYYGGYSVPSGTVSATQVGQPIPQGTYNIDITSTLQSPPAYHFILGCSPTVFIDGATASFSNVLVTGSSCNSLTITTPP
jgi:hypothetical protein